MINLNKKFDRVDSFPIKGVFASWVIFLYGDHLKFEMVIKKVLLSVPFGEPV